MDERSSLNKKLDPNAPPESELIDRVCPSCFTDRMREIEKGLAVPPRHPSISREFAQERWDAIGEDGYCYAHDDIGMGPCKGTSCTTCYPYVWGAYMGPCTSYGQDVTIMYQEEPIALGMGPRGQSMCASLALPMCITGGSCGCFSSILTVRQRPRIVAQFELEDQGPCSEPCCIFCCHQCKSRERTRLEPTRLPRQPLDACRTPLCGGVSLAPRRVRRLDLEALRLPQGDGSQEEGGDGRQEMRAVARA